MNTKISMYENINIFRLKAEKREHPFHRNRHKQGVGGWGEKGGVSVFNGSQIPVY